MLLFILLVCLYSLFDYLFFALGVEREGGVVECYGLLWGGVLEITITIVRAVIVMKGWLFRMVRRSSSPIEWLISLYMGGCSFVWWRGGF